MVAINPEMLRELLDEFTEKELVTREEMNAINQQIAELEKRIETSRVKLAGLNRDRDKINAMQERYLSGNWQVQLSNMAEGRAQAALGDSAVTEIDASSTADSPVIEATAALAPEASAVASAPPAPAASTAPAAPAAPAASAAAPAAGHTPAEGRAARRAAREAAKEAARETTAKVEPAPVPAAVQESAPVPAAVQESAPEPAPVPVPEPVLEPVKIAEPVTAPAPEPVQASEPVQAAAPVQSNLEAAPASSAPTFTAVGDDARNAVWGEPSAAVGNTADFNDNDDDDNEDLDDSSIEHAPPDDPIMSSFNSAPSGASAPDVASALAHGASQEQAPVEDTETSGFSWSSTAITAVPAEEQQQEQQQLGTASGAPAYGAFAQPSSGSSNSIASANPWGEPSPSVAPAQEMSQPVEQRQTPADIWGQPQTAQSAPAASAFQAPQASASAAPQAEGAGWGNFGEEWQMKEAESQKTTAANLPATSADANLAPEPPATAASAWGQPGASPWGQSSPAEPTANAAPISGGWGQPTASRQGMPAQPSPFAAPAQAAQPQSAQASEPITDAWGRSSQPVAAWGAPSAPVSSPWGDPNASSAPAPAPAPTPAQGDIFGTQPPPPPEGHEGEPRSSLARAADGALISPVKGRRRGPGTPAAFDWGQPDNAAGSDPAQGGASEDPNDNKKIDDVLKGLFK